MFRILWPGGATWFNNTGGYADAAKHLYNAILEANQNGEHYPLWATCLGMERLVLLETKDDDIRINCDSRKVAMPLNFTKGKY